MSRYLNCIWFVFTLTSCTLLLPISGQPAPERAKVRVIKPFIKLLNCLRRRKETFSVEKISLDQFKLQENQLPSSKNQTKFQVPLQENRFTPRFFKTFIFIWSGYFPVTIFFKTLLTACMANRKQDYIISITMQHFMKECQNARCNTKYINKFVSKY